MHPAAPLIGTASVNAMVDRLMAAVAGRLRAERGVVARRAAGRAGGNLIDDVVCPGRQ